MFLLPVKDVWTEVPNAQKMDGSELWNTLEGMEHGKGVEVWNEVRKEGECYHFLLLITSNIYS